MAFVFKCANCGNDTFTQKGFNSSRTQKRLVCKSCGKSTYVPVEEFEGNVIPTVTAPTVKEIVEVKTETNKSNPVWNEKETSKVNVTNDKVLTVDLENERKEQREPDVSKTRIININGQQGAFPNFTEAMVVTYANSMNHTLRYDEKDGIYYLTAKTGSKA